MKIKIDPIARQFVEYLLMIVNLVFLLFCPIVFLLTIERLLHYGSGWIQLIVSGLLFIVGVMMISIKKIGNKKNTLYKLWRTPLN